LTIGLHVLSNQTVIVRKFDAQFYRAGDFCMIVVVVACLVEWSVPLEKVTIDRKESERAIANVQSVKW